MLTDTPITTRSCDACGDVPSTYDWAYQEDALVQVSRTFALTIPQLPLPLRRVVGNAYLLCRIADTIEDCTSISPGEKRRFSDMFREVIEGKAEPEHFANVVAPRLNGGVTADEIELVKNAGRVLRITQSFSATSRKTLARCVEIMTQGMAFFQEKGSLGDGLTNEEELDRYCYHVAGVVGEMLTELFCEHSPKIAARKEELRRLAVSFGQGLQMTNILKDVWEDKRRNVCWLPRSVFKEHGVDLSTVSPQSRPAGFEEGIIQLVGLTIGHLDNAVRYALLIPKSEVGVRRFCLWAIGFAILTLRKISKKRNFCSGSEVTISRRSVYLTILVIGVIGWSNNLLELAFRAAAWGLPCNRHVVVSE